MKRYLVLTSVLAMFGLLAACNTMEGAGQDIQKGGKKLEDSADRHK